MSSADPPRRLSAPGAAPAPPPSVSLIDDADDRRSDPVADDDRRSDPVADDDRRSDPVADDDRRSDPVADDDRLVNVRHLLIARGPVGRSVGRQERTGSAGSRNDRLAVAGCVMDTGLG